MPLSRTLAQTLSRSLPAALAGAATLALPLSASAQTNCISRAESQAVVAHLMPNLIQSVGNHCAGVISGYTYLGAQGPALAQNLTPLSRRAWPAARDALERQSGNRLPDNEGILNIGRVAITDGIARGMDRNACQVVDQLVEQLAPLPPENLSNVFALFLEAGINNDPNSALRVCDAP